MMKEKTRGGSAGERRVSYGALFVRFFRYGLFTFGGGMGIVAQIQKTLVEKEELMSEEELLDITSVGRSLPGTMIGNVAVMVGYRMAGVVGSLVCVTGMVLPPFLILWGIARAYYVFRESTVVAAALYGIRAAVVPVIFSAFYRMRKGAFRYPPCFAVALLTFALYYFLNVNCVWLVCLGIVSGFAISEWYERTGT